MGFGKYYSVSITTAMASEDLMDTFRTDVGDDSATVKKLTLISSSAFTVSVNGAPIATIYQDTDALYKLSFEMGDILVSSLVVPENGVTIFMAAIY